MTALLGDACGGDVLARFDSLPDQPWTERETFRSGEHAVGMTTHGERDPGGWTWSVDEPVVGAIYGAAVLPDEYDDVGSLFEHVLTDPAAVLTDLEGSFALVVVDAETDRVVLGTDKLGTRPCYYTADGDLRFGTRLRPLLEAAGEFTVDGQAVSDLLLNGYLWGDRTLAEGVKLLPPASLLTYDGESRTRTRYWKPDFTPESPSDEFCATMAWRYREAVEAMAGTVEGELGLWLSGGLDSRSLLSVVTDDVTDVEDITTYTYDRNPVGGRNPEYARKIASIKNVDHHTVELTPTVFLESFRDAIDATDGMVRWNSLQNLSSVFALGADRPGVIAEAAGQGELLGEQIRRWWLTGPGSAVESMLHSEATLDPDRVSAILSYDVDPLGSYKRTAANSDEATTQGKILDAHFQNHYSRFVYASDNMARTQVGNRVPFAYGPFLEHVAKLPTEYRMGSVPLTEGSIPYGASRPKLELVRLLDSSLSAVPYERTGLSPARPYPAHVGGFVFNVGTEMAKQALSPRVEGYTGTSIGSAWYRAGDELGSYLDGLASDAGERPLFDAGRVDHLRQSHLAGEADHFNAIAAITTLEQWLQLVEENCRVSYP